MLEYGGFYRTSDQTFVKFERIQFVGACNPPTDPGRKPLSHRYTKYFEKHDLPKQTVIWIITNFNFMYLHRYSRTQIFAGFHVQLFLHFCSNLVAVVVSKTDCWKWYFNVLLQQCIHFLEKEKKAPLEPDSDNQQKINENYSRHTERVSLYLHDFVLFVQVPASCTGCVCGLSREDLPDPDLRNLQQSHAETCTQSETICWTSHQCYGRILPHVTGWCHLNVCLSLNRLIDKCKHFTLFLLL